jgi:hypothetical protein
MYIFQEIASVHAVFQAKTCPQARKSVISLS